MIDKLKMAFSKENLLDAMVLIIGMVVVKAIRGFLSGLVLTAENKPMIPYVVWDIVATVLVAFIPYRRRMWVIAGVAVMVDDAVLMISGKTLHDLIGSFIPVPFT